MIQYTQCSVVIALNGHSPTILSEEFLKDLVVVPRDWVTSDIIVTPPLSRISYTNGFVILIESNRVIIEVNNLEAVEATQCALSAINFISGVPYARYRAVGFNYKAEVTAKNAEEIIREKLVNSTASNSMLGLHLNAMQWKGDYDDCQLTLAIELSAGEEGQQQFINANYHRVRESIESVEETLNRFEADMANFAERINSLMT